MKPVNSDVLTTGQIARLLKVAPRTVSKWIDCDKLKGHRIPSGGDNSFGTRRVLRGDFNEFCRKHGIKLPQNTVSTYCVFLCGDCTSIALNLWAQHVDLNKQGFSPSTISAFGCLAIADVFHAALLLNASVSPDCLCIDSTSFGNDNATSVVQAFSSVPTVVVPCEDDALGTLWKGYTNVQIVPRTLAGQAVVELCRKRESQQ